MSFIVNNITTLFKPNSDQDDDLIVISIGICPSSVSASASRPPMKIKRINEPGSIVHCVSKMDTLAGIAIKYGVEIGDIKRMNSLVTDLQMFAHNNLRIPLPGKHPPSNRVQVQDPSGGCGSPSNVLHKSQPPKRTASQDMSTLQGYYRLTTSLQSEQMTAYRINVSESPPGTLPVTDNSRETLKAAKSGGGVNNSVRRRQKADTDSSCCMPPPPLPDYFSSRDNLEYTTPRKSKSRLDLNSANLFVTTDQGGLCSIAKPMSTTNLLDSDVPSLWPSSNWAFKADTISRSAYPSRQKAALD